MKKVILAAGLLVSSLVFAQDNSTIVRADKAMKNYELVDAIKSYQEALEDDQTNVYAMLQLAKCYRMQNNIPMAAKWYEKSVFAADSEPINKYYYAEVLRQMGQYDKAKTFYEDYAKWYPEDTRAQLGITSCNESMAIQARPALFAIENQKSLNSSANEFGATMEEGNMVLFASDRNAAQKVNYTYGYTGQGFLDTYSSKRDKNEYSSIKMTGARTNSLYHDANFVTSPNNKLAAFSRNQFRQNFIGGSVKKAQADDVVKLKIMLSNFSEKTGKWNDYFEASFNDPEYSFTHPTFSLDGQTLYFVSDMPGGSGGTDIWMAKIKEDLTMDTPVNAGTGVNTAGNEMYPFISNDGSLYFSSNGQAGLGGLDIFRAEMGSNGLYSGAYNLGSPLNSSMDDFSFNYDNKNPMGYIASNRLGGLGGDDIYSAKMIGIFSTIELVDASTQKALGNTEVCFTVNGKEIARGTTSADGTLFMPLAVNQKYTVSICDGTYMAKDAEINTYGKAVGSSIKETIYAYPVGNTFISGLVLEQNSNLPVGNSTVTLINGNTGETKAVTTDEYGFYRFEIFAGVEEYSIEATKSEYVGQVVKFDTKSIEANSEKKQNLILSGGQIICNLAFNNIYFDLNKADLREDSMDDLNKMLQILTLSDQVRVEIAAHTDSRGSDAYNLSLSDKRAKSVLEWLSSKGIAMDRLKYKGYGETELNNACGNGVECSEEEHQKNRRVEFKVLNSDGEVLCKSRKK
jgi:outer membrane protein OmpA-like peptidoglycan-associated protein/tetratricopeptide (TPR) repeat protein